jgi:uncharacterized membrane protein
MPQLRWAWLLVGLLISAYTIISVSRYTHFASRSWDLAIFDVALRDYARLRPPIVEIKGPDFNLLGDHFSPLLAVLAPVYRLWPTPVTLLVAQAALIGLSVLPITRLAVRYLGSTRGLALGLAYGLSWGLIQAVNADFHEVCLAVPLLAFALEAYVDAKWRRAAAWVLWLILVKEDLGLTIAMLGLCMAIRGQRRMGTALAVVGVAGSAVTIGLIMPTVATHGGYAYWALLRGPHHGFWALAAQLFTPSTKLLTLVLLFALTGFLALRSPLALLVLPTLLWRFLASSPSFWGWDWHYSAILMPVMFAAVVDALELVRGSTRRWLRVYGAHAVMAVVLPTAVGLAARLPFRDLFTPTTYQSGARADDARRALAVIPSGRSVEANVDLMAHLTGRCIVYVVGQRTNPTPDFIAIDGAVESHQVDSIAYASKFHPGAHYVLVYSSAYFRVLVRSK